jgi:hypothetical protein
MLRTLLAEPIRFTPVLEDRRRGYRFEGRIALDRMVAGLVLPELSAKLHQLVSSPGGFVNRWRPPFDGFSASQPDAVVLTAVWAFRRSRRAAWAGAVVRRRV